MHDCFICEIHDGKQESKHIGKYVSLLNFFNISLVFFSIASGSVTVASVAPATSAPIKILLLCF